MSFALILVLLTGITGLIALIDLIWGRAYRKKQAKTQPKWIEHTISFFPIFLLVLLLRSFLIEPFRIPSGSLEPSLLVGDFVAVNKYIYGLRLPVLDTKVIPISNPKRGDVVVFSWPPNPEYDYIKRVIGLPGDEVEYKEKVLYINGKKAKQTFIEYTIDNDEQGTPWKVIKKSENLLGVKHEIYVRPDIAPYDFKLTVPKGHYFMMGDNRDNSSDSRYWGLVPEKNLRGKAFLVWLSWDSQLSSIRFNRVGKLIH